MFPSEMAILMAIAATRDSGKKLFSSTIISRSGNIHIDIEV